jgi:hypothetical protein
VSTDQTLSRAGSLLQFRFMCSLEVMGTVNQANKNGKPEGFPFFITRRNQMT